MDPVEVYARIRHVSNGSRQETCLKVVNEKTLHLVSSSNKCTECQFVRLFDQTVAQLEIFQVVAKPLVEDLLLGKNGLIFTYGVTCSGKTFTMMGTNSDPGILPRTLDMLFNSIVSVQASKSTFIPSTTNSFDIQSNFHSLLHRPEEDYQVQGDNISSCTKQLKKPLALSKVEHCSSDKINEDCCYAVFVSFVEIYNDYIYDLLCEPQFDNFNKVKKPQSKRLREDKNKTMYVYGSVQVEVKSASEALAVFERGMKQRQIAQTALNSESSRSHSVFNIRLVQAPLDPLGDDVLQEESLLCVRELSLVDLAGSERIKRTGAGGDRLKEAGNINSSLMTLRRCFEQLRGNQKTNKKEIVKYRNSKLSHLFKSYFEGNGKVKMVICLNPLAQEYDENLQVVQFAEVAQQVEVASSQEFKINRDLIQQKAVEIKRKEAEMEKKQERATWQLSSALCDNACEPCTNTNLTSGSNCDWESINYNFANWPNLDLVDSNDSETLPMLISYLENHIEVSDNYKDSVCGVSSLFKNGLRNQMKFDEHLKMEIQDINCELQVKTKDHNKLEKQVKKLENKNQFLIKCLQTLEKDGKLLQSQLEIAECQVKASHSEKQKSQSKLKSAVENAKAQMLQQCEKKVWKLQTELNSKMLMKEEYLHQLKNIVVGCKVSCKAKSEFEAKESRSLLRKPLNSLTQVSNSYLVNAKQDLPRKRRSRSADDPHFDEGSCNLMKGQKFSIAEKHKLVNKDIEEHNNKSRIFNESNSKKCFQASFTRKRKSDVFEGDTEEEQSSWSDLEIKPGSKCSKG